MGLFSDWIDWFLGWPLILYAVGISVICTLVFRFVQIRYFFSAFQSLFAFEKKKTAREMSPFDAFLNTLSSNLGNGSVAGAAVAVFTGGPGAGLWVMIIGFLLMAVRFAEVYASTMVGEKAPANAVLGGPMLYLQEVIGGSFLSYAYAVACFFFSLIVGNAMQTHAISWSIETTWGVQPLLIAVILTAFIGYVVMGGAHRIIAVSDRLVPIKVLVFFVSSLIVIFYNSHALLGSLKLIYTSAFSPSAAAGGAMGFALMHAMKSGMNLSLTATESGLGTAAILFGYTGSKDPMRSALMGMMSTFVSSLVCFLVVLCVVISGVWDSGLTSTALTIAAFKTTFGWLGGWIVSFLSISFGLGVLVALAYISRAAWLCVTNGRYENAFPIIYCIAAFLGAIAEVHILWTAVSIINGIMLTINLFGLLYLAPAIRRDMVARGNE